MIERRGLRPFPKGLPEHALASLAEGRGRIETDPGREDQEPVVSRAVRMAALKVALVGIVIVGGWVFRYTDPTHDVPAGASAVGCACGSGSHAQIRGALEAGRRCLLL
jgi:hypothetical protein